MKISFRSHLAAGLACLVLAACATERPVPGEPSAVASHGKRITTRQAFRNLMAGKIFSNELGFGRCHTDGTLTGEINGRKLTGFWHWEGRFFCRSIGLGGEYFDSDCQTVFISGDELTVVRKRGKGETVTYRLQTPES